MIHLLAGWTSNKAHSKQRMRWECRHVFWCILVLFFCSFWAWNFLHPPLFIIWFCKCLSPKVKSALKIISTWEWASICLLSFSPVHVLPTDNEVGCLSFPGNLSGYVLLMLWILLYISFLGAVFLAILCAAAIVGVAFFTLSCRAKLYKHCDCRISWRVHGAVKQTMARWNYLPWLIHFMEQQSSSFTCSVGASLLPFCFLLFLSGIRVVENHI